MKILNKIQALSDKGKKIILWITLIIIGIFLIVFYIQNMKNKVKNLKEEDIEEGLQISEIKERFKNLPKFEIPEEIKSIFEEITSSSPSNEKE